MARYGRRYELVIGEGGTTGTKVSDNQITFDISKSSGAKMNTGVFSIFNLSNATRQKLQELEQKDGILTFKVGYLGEPLTEIFFGNIISITSTPRSPDIVTEVVCGDGYASIRDAKSNRQFPKKTSLRSVVTALIDDLGLAKGNLKGDALDSHTFNNGLIVEGVTVVKLNEYTQDSAYNLEWSIQDGAVNVLPRGGAKTGTALLINEAAGLIGSPEPTGKRPGAEKGAKEPTLGLKIVTLLNPLIKVSQKVRVQSKFVDSEYVVNELVHTGDYEGQAWYTEAKLVTEEERT